MIVAAVQWFLIDIYIGTQYSIMMPRKRLPSHQDVRNTKKRRIESKECVGNAIKMEIQIIAKIPADMAHVIWEFSKGQWTTCTRCKELIDDKFGKPLYSLNEEIKYRCIDCDEIISKWINSVNNKFVF